MSDDISKELAIVTPGKWSDILERLLKQSIDKGWVSDSLSEFDFDVQYDPVKCVISHRVPLIMRRYYTSIQLGDEPDGTQNAPTTAQETDEAARIGEGSPSVDSGETD